MVEEDLREAEGKLAKANRELAGYQLKVDELHAELVDAGLAEARCKSAERARAAKFAGKKETGMLTATKYEQDLFHEHNKIRVRPLPFIKKL